MATAHCAAGETQIKHVLRVCIFTGTICGFGCLPLRTPLPRVHDRAKTFLQAWRLKRAEEAAKAEEDREPRAEMSASLLYAVMFLSGGERHDERVHVKSENV